MKNKSTGEIIRMMLDYRGMSQRELAEKIDCTEVSISRYVNGTREPKFETMLRIAKACGYDFEVVEL